METLDINKLNNFGNIKTIVWINYAVITKRFTLNGQIDEAVLRFRSLHQKLILNKILREFVAFCCIHINNF